MKDSFEKPMTDKDVKRFIKQLHDLSTTPVLLGKILDLVPYDIYAPFIRGIELYEVIPPARAKNLLNYGYRRSGLAHARRP